MFIVFQIDDEADAAGIKFVKIEDNQLAKEYGVYALPGLIFFKKGEDIPVIFAGKYLHIHYFCIMISYHVQQVISRKLKEFLNG